MVGSRRSGKVAFSLIEVVIALGLAVFVIIALLGLGSLVIDQTGESKKDILQVNMTQETGTDLRNTPWDDLGSFPQYYFDAEGRRLTNASGAYYTCEAIAVVGGISGAPSDLEDNLRRYVLVLSWPTGVPDSHKITMPWQVARHD